MIRIRPDTPDDRDFILSLAGRLAAGGVFPWRKPAHVRHFQDRFMAECLAIEDAHRFVACAPDGTRLGFVQVEPADDPIDGISCGYVSLLAVAAEAEGSGVGGRLLDRAEQWCREQGFATMQLDVFASNRNARAFYRRRGFGEEALRLVRPLDLEA
jgi:ribosomal protein S18 acetylase RimI-like enzyme